MIKQLTSALCGLMLLTGCAVVGSDYRLPPTELGGEFADASQGGLSSDSIDTTWELDFFGRVRRSVEARTAEVEAQEASLPMSW